MPKWLDKILPNKDVEDEERKKNKRIKLGK